MFWLLVKLLNSHCMDYLEIWYRYFGVERIFVTLIHLTFPYSAILRFIEF